MSDQDQQIIQWREELSKQAQYHYRRRYIPGMLKILQKLRDRRKRDPENLDLLDTATANVILFAAEAYLDDLHFEECFELSQEAISVLREKANRAILAGKKARHDSLAWCYAICVLADAKWKYEHDCQNHIMTSERMITDFLCIRRRVCEVTDPSKTGLQKSRIRFHNLVLCGAMLIKVAIRYRLPELETLANETNQVIPGILDDPEESYYWDLQIAAAYFNGSASHQNLNYYYRQRIRGMKRELFSEEELEAYRKSADNERAYLFAHPLANSPST